MPIVRSWKKINNFKIEKTWNIPNWRKNWTEKMASTSASNNPQLKGLSNQQLESIYQYITGFENMTDLNEPILRPGLQDTYYFFVLQYAILSLFGIVANIWVICYIFKYKLFHENTHAFFVNLCVCHFVQSAFVLPITLIVIIVHNWILGQFMCYFVPMLQVCKIVLFSWNFCVDIQSDLQFVIFVVILLLLL